MTYAVILAGGIGSRFWPFSRELEPKQFMKIIGEHSLLQATVKRLKGLIPAENIFIVTNNIYFYEVLNQLRGCGIPKENIILEPRGKNTAAAIGLSARLINIKDKDALLVVLPADHYIKNLDKFKKVIQSAIKCARKDFLVTIGIKPRNPSIGYGYIKTGSRMPSSDAYKAEQFLEKPNLSLANKYFKDKRFFWNSGMFAWKASVFLEEVKQYLPDLYRSLMLVKNNNDIAKVWPGIKAISVDYGIMERSRKIAIIPASFYWTDLGSWDALSQVFPKDRQGNILSSDTVNLGSNNVCVFSKSNRLISLVGLKDIIVADTPDALLICRKDKAQEVKKVAESLKNRQRKEYFTHLTERRPWGNFTVLQSDSNFKIKLIEIAPKKRLSLQKHKKRAEHWVVVSGCAKVTSGKNVKTVKANTSIYVPQGATHRLENTKNKPLRIVEVQTGAYLGEDDIERFQDDFKRR